jgi:dihydroorotase-like cyclic amidohydrolase
VRALEAQAALLTDALSPVCEAGRRQADPLSYLEVLRDRNAISTRFAELESMVEREILVFNKPPYATPPQENLAGLEVARKYEARGLYESSLFDDPQALAGVRRFVEAGEQARVVPELPVKLVVIDEAVVMFGMHDPLAELPAMVDEGVPTAKAFMVFDFRLADRSIFEAMRILGERGGMLEVHCEDPVLIDAAVEAALQRGDTAPRHHAATRSTEAEAVATHRAMAFARAADAPVHVVHLSCEAALRYVAEARATGVRATAETCPHYLVLTDARYDEPDPIECAKSIISPPLRAASDVEALWAALATGDLSLVATDHVPDRVAVEKGEAARGIPFDRISNGAPGIETLLAIVFGEGVARGRISVERMVDLLATTPARRFGLERKGAIEVGRDADLVLFDPAARRTIRAADLHHTSDYTPYEGLEVAGAVRSVFVRGRAVIRDGVPVGDRGFGRFVERGAISGEPAKG